MTAKRCKLQEGVAGKGFGKEPLAEMPTPLLRLRYNNAIADAAADLGSADVSQRLSVPGVDQPHPGARKVCSVACHQRQVVLQRCGSQQAVHRWQGAARAAK